MFLLIRICDTVTVMIEKPLHSNMFLLIPGSIDSAAGEILFTFQYVSINTGTTTREEFKLSVFTFQYVSINTQSQL